MALHLIKVRMIDKKSMLSYLKVITMAVSLFYPTTRLIIHFRRNCFDDQGGNNSKLCTIFLIVLDKILPQL